MQFKFYQILVYQELPIIDYITPKRIQYDKYIYHCELCSHNSQVTSHNYIRNHNYVGYIYNFVSLKRSQKIHNS